MRARATHERGDDPPRRRRHDRLVGTGHDRGERAVHVEQHEERRTGETLVHRGGERRDGTTGPVTDRGARGWRQHVGEVATGPCGTAAMAGATVGATAATAAAGGALASINAAVRERMASSQSKIVES